MLATETTNPIDVTQSQSAKTDPHTNTQYPTAAKIPDVTHILNRTFGKTFTKDLIKLDTIKNLTISADVDDVYHRRYVDKLKETQLKKESKIQSYVMIKKHLIESKARSLASYDDSESSESISSEILPRKSSSYYKYCINHSLLKQNGLIAPSDYSSKQTIIPNDDVSNSLVSTSQGSFEKLNLPYMNQKDLENLDRTIREASARNRLAKLKIDPGTSREISNHLDRIENRNNLKLIEKKTRFLSNPRSKVLDSNTKDQNVQVFKAIPENVTFDKYMIGKVYEKCLEIRNVSLISQQLKIIPPKTQYFSLSLGSYPQANSIIAPGMSVYYNVRFAPDSLCLFEDELNVECCNGSSLNIPVIAKRKSPVLSISRKFDCGKALVGQMKVCRFIIKNSGGEGRFAILPKSTWLNSYFKTNISSSVLSIAPFEIQPSIFEIQENDTIALEVVFKPNDTKFYDQVVVVACDNCTSLEFQITGEGEVPKIELVNQDDPQDNPLNAVLAEDEFKDSMCNGIVRFDDLNPNAQMKKKFVISNGSSSPIDFTWVIYKPNFESNLLNEKTKNKWVYIVDKEAPYHIEPKQGVLERYTANEFEFRFTPTRVGNYDCVAHLILHGLPDITKQMMNDKYNRIHKAVLHRDDTQVGDYTVYQLELKGVCEPFKIALDPPAIYVPGVINPTSTIRKSFRMINISSSPIHFNWKHLCNEHVIEVEPSYGEIAPKSYGLMEALITGLTPGLIKQNLECFVEFMDEPVILYIEADVKPPECIIHEADIDFNLVRLGSMARVSLTVENTSGLQLHWTLACPDDTDQLFTFDETGVLNPLETKKIEIKLFGKAEMIIEKYFEFKIINGASRTIKCVAQIQKPLACILNSEPVLEDLYVSKEKPYTIRLCNQTMLETTYEFAIPELEDKQLCALDVTPRTGILRPNENLDVQLGITPFKIDHISDIRIPCFVGGMLEPLFINLNGMVKGVSLAYSVSEESDFSLLSPNDFKDNNSTIVAYNSIQINANSTKYLFIQNTTPITTKLELRMKQFELKTHDEHSQHAALLSHKEILRKNSTGIQFTVDKKHLSLGAYETITVALTVHPTMWGIYEDDLEIIAENMETIQELPVFVDAIGNPIKIYTGKSFEENKDEIPIIRFGSQIKSNRLIGRKLKIQNLCTSTFEINWSVYLINPYDLKLIDLKVVPFFKMENFIRNVQNKDDAESKTDKDSSRVVKINLTPHYGEHVPSNKLFTISTKKTVIKPHERLSLDIVLDLNNVTYGVHEAMFVGYIDLDHNLRHGDGVYRKTMFELSPIKFKAQVENIPPKLTIEYAEDDGLEFNLSFGSLIEANRILQEKMFQKEFFITNVLSIPVDFELVTQGQFYIQNVFCTSFPVQLKPKEKIKLKVLFKVQKDQLSVAKADKDYNLFNDTLSFYFNGEINQEIQLTAKVHLSNLTTNTDIIDFGRVLVGKTSHKQFVLRNQSKCTTNWSLSFKSDSNKPYSCDIFDGALVADSFYQKKSEQLISVFFTPEHDSRYNDELVIKDDLTNEVRRLKVMGRGSYDEFDEPYY